LSDALKHPSEIADALKQLWTDAEVQFWYKDHKYQLAGHHYYYLKRLTAILSDNYIPLKQDILYVNKKLLGNINEIKCQLGASMNGYYNSIR
jgi:hypothetical protein